MLVFIQNLANLWAKQTPEVPEESLPIGPEVVKT